VAHGDLPARQRDLSPAGRVRVVVDWELCTLGDPLAAVVTATARVLHHGQSTTTLKESTSMRTSEAPVHAAMATMTTMRMGTIQIHV
jgi:aminoglycoside phosphotransferase (APT) family kinase protein